MRKRSRTAGLFTGMLLGCLGLALSTVARAETETETLLRAEGTPGTPGGRLVVALRAEPKTFNPVLALDNPSQTVLQRLMADLVHVDRHTQLTEPALAESWTASEDGRRYQVELRRGLRFSDGEPFDADDVLFTFRVHLDPAIDSPHRALLQVDGVPVVVRKLDSHRLVFEFAAPYAVGERLFDSIAILPAHRLEAVYREGGFASAWGPGSDPEKIVGLGAFRLKEYRPGERLIVERNPHYWKVDRRDQRLPYLDELVFVFVPGEQAQVLRFEAGETHLIDRLSAESFEQLQRTAGERGLEMRDLGPGLAFQFLFFNLNQVDAEKMPEVAAAQAWFRQTGFRAAVSAAVDRQGIVKLVYRGRATPVLSHVTGGNRRWTNERLKPPPASLDAARQLLRKAGFSWREDGSLHDAAGRPVAFTLVTNSGNREREQIATIVQEDLRRLGIAVNIAPLEFTALVERLFNTHDYQVCLLGLGGGDTDPNGSLDVVASSGRRHLWHLGQEEPATPWEAEIDRLMERQLGEIDGAERKRLFDRVQEILAAQLPWIPLVSPNVLVGADRRLGNFRPAVLHHSTLWNADELFWRPDPSAGP